MTKDNTAPVAAILLLAKRGVKPLPKPQVDDLPANGWYERRSYDGGRRQYLYYRWRHTYGKGKQSRILARNLGRLQ